MHYKLLSLSLLFCVHAHGMSPERFQLSSADVHMPEEIRDHKLIFDNNEFKIEGPRETHRIPRWNLSPELRGIDKYQLKNFVGAGYIRVKALSAENKEYQLTSCVRGNGGGPFLAALGFWAVRAVGYGIPALAASKIGYDTATAAQDWYKRLREVEGGAMHQNYLEAGWVFTDASTGEKVSLKDVNNNIKTNLMNGTYTSALGATVSVQGGAIRINPPAFGPAALSSINDPNASQINQAAMRNEPQLLSHDPMANRPVKLSLNIGPTIDYQDPNKVSREKLALSAVAAATGTVFKAVADNPIPSTEVSEIAGQALESSLSTALGEDGPGILTVGATAAGVTVAAYVGFVESTATAFATFLAGLPTP